MPKTHVKPPRPMEVKKFIAKRVLHGSSRGKTPSNAACKVLGKQAYNFRHLLNQVNEGKQRTHPLVARSVWLDPYIRLVPGREF